MDDRKTEQAPDSRPSNDNDRAEQGRRNRDEMDETPPPGTDPLHEGP